MKLSKIPCAGTSDAGCPRKRTFFQKNARHMRCRDCQREHRKIIVATKHLPLRVVVTQKEAPKEERIHDMIGAMKVFDAMMRAASF